MSQLPMQWDPVEYRYRIKDLTQVERVQECIFAWVESLETDSDLLADAAWDRLRHACTDWIREEAKSRPKREQSEMFADSVTDKQGSA